jgi:hypothetical protein
MLLLGVLVETRGTVRADQFFEAATRFVRAVGPREDESWPEEIEREARAGLAEERTSIPIEQLDPDGQPVDVELTVDSGVWRGRWAWRELRLSAPLEVLEPVLDGRRLRGIAEREVIPALKRILGGRMPLVDAMGDGGTRCADAFPRAAARQQHWNIDIRRPFARPEQVVQYFARYTRRIAISDRRITAYDGQI